MSLRFNKTCLRVSSPKFFWFIRLADFAYHRTQTHRNTLREILFYYYRYYIMYRVFIYKNVSKETDDFILLWMLLILTLKLKKIIFTLCFRIYFRFIILRFYNTKGIRYHFCYFFVPENLSEILEKNSLPPKRSKKNQSMLKMRYPCKINKKRIRNAYKHLWCINIKICNYILFDYWYIWFILLWGSRSQ